jgi:amino acid permease
MNPVIVYWSGASSNLTQRQFIIPMAGCFVIYPLCLLRSLKALAPASAVAVFCVSFASLAIVVRGVQTLINSGIAEGCCELQDKSAWIEEFGWNCEDVENNISSCGCCHDNAVGDERIAAFGVGIDFLRPIGIVVFALLTHIQTPSLYAELKDPGLDAKPHVSPSCLGSIPGAPLNDSSGTTCHVPLLNDKISVEEEQYTISSCDLRRELLMRQVIFIAMSAVATFYVTVGSFGYFQFGEDVKSNVLNSYGSDDNFINVARVCICCLVSLTYPVLQVVARSMMHELTSSGKANEKGGNMEMPLWKHVLLTTCYVSLTIVLGIEIEDLGIVIGALGSIAGVLAMFLFPGFLLVAPNGPYQLKVDMAVRGRNGHYYAGAALIFSGIIIIFLSLLDLFGAF